MHNVHGWPAVSADIFKCASDAHFTVPLGHGRGDERNKSQDNDNMAGVVCPAVDNKHIHTKQNTCFFNGCEFFPHQM